jgi:CheY-like chemotaxis protein
MALSIAAVVTDLIFGTKISSSAKSLGIELKIIRSMDKLDDRLSSAADSFVLIDLNADGVDVIEAIRRCKAATHRPRTIAYVSHVQTELIERARQAGADEVMARSAFVARLPAVLSTSVEPSGAHRTSQEEQR